MPPIACSTVTAPSTLPPCSFLMALRRSFKGFDAGSNKYKQGLVGGWWAALETRRRVGCWGRRREGWPAGAAGRGALARPAPACRRPFPSCGRAALGSWPPLACPYHPPQRPVASQTLRPSVPLCPVRPGRWRRRPTGGGTQAAATQAGPPRRACSSGILAATAALRSVVRVRTPAGNTSG